MNRDDIIRMADEACIYMDSDTDHWYYELERFAALVAAAEREACAQVCEAERGRLFWSHNVQVNSADKLAAAIRARGQA